MNPKKLLRIVASLCLVGLVFWLVGPARIVAAFANADPAWLLAGMASSAAASLFSALRWHSLARWLGIDVSRRFLALAYWRGITANSVLPGATLGGDTLRAVSLHQAGHSLFTATISVVLDRFSGLWVLAVVSLSMSAIALAAGWLPAGLLPLSPEAAAVLAAFSLLAPLLVWQLSASVTRRLPGKYAELLAVVHQRPQPFAQYLAQLGWSGLVQLASILAFACGGWAVGLEVPFWQFMVVAGPVFIFAALPVSVGGWGTREAAAAVVLGLIGAPRDLAVAAAVLYGIFATVQGLLGAFTLLKLRRAQ